MQHETIQIAIYCLIFITTVASALVVILSPNALYSALALIVTMGTIAVNFLLMRAEFVALVQILVYAGAIMVLFLFVIMLLNLRSGEPSAARFYPRRTVGLALVAIFIAQASYIGWYFMHGLAMLPGAGDKEMHEYTILELAEGMFTRYLIPFELTSVLLLVAIVGALSIGIADRPKE